MIDELSSHRERFKQLWTQADVGYLKGIDHMHHPQVGDLYLTRSKLDLPHSGGQHILALHAKPGSDSAKALEALRSQAKSLPRASAGRN
jgi:MmyB-like transcription regulator ligand binding domain